MTDNHTKFLYQTPERYIGRPAAASIKPRLFVCCEHEIMEFALEGHQRLGRPAEQEIPDIPVTNRYLSRDHGFFETDGGLVTYTAAKTTNGTIFRRRQLEPGERVELWDGDELIVPASDSENGVDILLVCAIVENRIKIWRDMRLASRDALTGLSGRNTFRTWYLQRYRRFVDDRCSLFMLDIDFFKRINDVYGHSAGDAALKYLTEQLLLTVASDGYVCRWGGDEFVGIIMNDALNAKLALEEMSERIAATRIDDRFNMTISAGVVDIHSVPDPGDVDAIVIRADQMLYQAKENGKNRIEA